MGKIRIKKAQSFKFHYKKPRYSSIGSKHYPNKRETSQKTAALFPNVNCSLKNTNRYVRKLGLELTDATYLKLHFPKRIPSIFATARELSRVEE